MKSLNHKKIGREDFRQQRKTIRAIILGIDPHPRCVATIRSLGRAGIDVIGVDHRPPATRSHSRYIKKKFFISSDTELASKALEDLGRDGGGLLVPTSDQYLVLVAKNYDRLSKHFTMTTPRWEILQRLMDRPQCYALAREIGIQTPRFFVPHDLGETRRIITGLNFKDHAYILKTNVWMSGTANPKTSRYTINAGPDAVSMEERCQEIFSRTGMLPVIEEILPGEADTCIGVSMVVNHNHKPVLWYCIKRIKLYTYLRARAGMHPYELGTNTCCESVHDDEALEAAKRLVERAEFFGLVTVEFRRDSTDGGLKLIKVDPRPVRATSLSTALGLDLPTTLYNVFTDGQVNPSHPYPDGVGWLWLTNYLEALWVNRSNNSFREEFFALLRNLRRAKAFGILSAHDPLPFWIEVKPLFLLWLKRFLRSVLPPRVVSGLKGMMVLRYRKAH